MVETEQVGVIGNWISCSGTLKFKDIRNISRLFFFFKVNWSLPVMLETVQPRELELTKRTPNTPMFQDFQESSISFLGSLKYYSVKVLILLGSAFIFHLSICPAIQAWLYLVSIYSSVCSSLPLWAESMSVFISTRLLSGCRWDLLWDFLHAFVRAYKKPLLSECLLLPLVLMCFIERLWIIESSSERSVSRGFAEEEGGDRRIPPVNTPQTGCLEELPFWLALLMSARRLTL